MNHRNIVAAIGCLALVACSDAPVDDAAASARPVKTMIVESPAGSGVRNFPGRIDSANRADLAFRVPGTVARLSVSEGAPITRGQELARLDQTDYEIALRDRQATWDRASKDYERSQDLVDRGAISRRDFDRVEANFKSADAALAQAKQNLEYTTLRAPFDGNVARRHVDAFEEVNPGQTVYSVMDQSALEVKIDIPENVIMMLASPQSEPGERSDDIEVWAAFDMASQRRFPLEFKEVATRADPQTQTFEVTFTLPAPDEVTILPGMTASVTLDLSRVLNVESVYYLPVTAVSGSEGLSPRVWAVDEDTMTVREQPVMLGRLVGSTVEVTEGLEPGMRIVTAGAAYLAEGMAVTLLAQSEQAEPREEDMPRPG